MCQGRFAVKRAILAIALCGCVLPSRAWAVDWSLNSTLSETVELNNNLYMRSMLAGGAFGNGVVGSYSTITANATARTPTSNFNFGGDINYRKYFGPGAEGTATESLSGGMRARYERSENTGKEYIYGSWRRQNTSLALLSDLGVTTPVKGDINVTTIGGGIDRSITRSDTISLSARSTLTTYDPAKSGTQFTDSSANATWQHRLNGRLSLTASSDVEWQDFDNATNTRILYVRETAGVNATLSPLLSFRGTAGVIYVRGEGLGTGVLFPSSFGTISLFPGSTQTASSGSNIGWVGDMSLTYRMLKNTTATLSVSRTEAPSVVGSLTQRTTIQAGLNQTINTRSSLSLAASASRQTSSGTTGDYLSASLGYSYLLTREWSAQMSYRYLHRFAQSGSTTGVVTFDPITGLPIVSGTGPATSNSILLVVSRSVSILPDGY